jgi:hypothetical protein
MRTPDQVADEGLVGAEIVFGATPLGHVEAVLHEPTLTAGQPDDHVLWSEQAPGCFVPMECVVRRTPARVTIGVGTQALDDLPTHVDIGSAN